ncbi:MAG: LPS export ABC transporter permease LptG [Spongiibacteraceae bacterium]
MHKLNRYFSTIISSSIFLVLLVFLSLDSIGSIIDEVGDLAGNYTFFSALKFVFFSVPGNVFDVLPFAALIGCLAGLGTLAGNSELVVIRSAGVSTGRIVWMVMRPAIVIMLLGMLISEYIAPHTESIAQSHRSTALRQTDNIVSSYGLWHREGNQFMHFDVVEPNGVLYGLTMYNFTDEGKLSTALSAKRAIYQANHWLLEDVVESRFLDDRVEQSVTASRPWDTELSPTLLNILVLDPLDLSIKGLWQYSSYLQSQSLDSGTYRLAFWKKVLQPLSTVALVLVAISFIFGPLREVTMGYRIFIGVLVGIVFRISQDMLAPASLVYGFQPIYASLVPIIICFAGGFWFLVRTK